MPRVIRGTIRPIGRALVLALAVVLSADCMTGRDMTPEQKACCAEMGPDCDHSAMAADCCVSENNPDLQQTTAKLNLAPPVAVANPLATAHQLPRVRLELSVQSAARHLPDVPAYFLGSAFLI
jgi:hypothetical protein